MFECSNFAVEITYWTTSNFRWNKFQDFQDFLDFQRTSCCWTSRGLPGLPGLPIIIMFSGQQTDGRQQTVVHKLETRRENCGERTKLSEN